MKDLKNLNFLLPKTREVLIKLIEYEYMSNFVLVGGSALALYMKHRKSEDLDFFTYEKDTFEAKKIKQIIKKFKGKIVNISNEQIDVLINGVKVTFFDAKWFFLRPKKIQKFGIKKVFEMSKNVLDGINFKLFAAALLYIDDIEDENIDYLEPEQKLSLIDIQKFFEEELKNL